LKNDSPDFDATADFLGQSPDNTSKQENIEEYLTKRRSIDFTTMSQEDLLSYRGQLLKEIDLINNLLKTKFIRTPSTPSITNGYMTEKPVPPSSTHAISTVTSPSNSTISVIQSCPSNSGVLSSHAPDSISYQKSSNIQHNRNSMTSYSHYHPYHLPATSSQMAPTTPFLHPQCQPTYAPSNSRPHFESIPMSTKYPSHPPYLVSQYSSFWCSASGVPRSIQTHPVRSSSTSLLSPSTSNSSLSTSGNHLPPAMGRADIEKPMHSHRLSVSSLCESNVE